MIDKIQWKEPTEITERTLRNETAPMLREMFKQCTRYFLMGGIPIAILCFFVNRSLLVGMLAGLAYVIYQIPLIAWIISRLVHKYGVKHEVNLKGIYVNRNFFPWRRVEGYKFNDAAQMPDVGNLSIKIRQSKQWRNLSYYRSDVKEEELLAMLERFAPQHESLPDKHSIHANLERRKQEILRLIRMTGVFSFLTGIGAVWAIGEWLNINSHNPFLPAVMSACLVLFPIMLLLFFVGISIYRRLMREIVLNETGQNISID